jgi:ABC-type nickel/cobalt efflux system permease component RcnA
MREFFITANSDSADWLIFLGMLLLICLAIGIFVIWFTIFRNKGKKRRKRHHHRHHDHQGSPLSARGGLPPRREPPGKSPPSAL